VTVDDQLAAIKMARSIDGVRGVDNYMQLAPSGGGVRAAA